LVLLAIVASMVFCLWRKKAKKAVVEKPESIKPQTTVSPSPFLTRYSLLVIEIDTL
jgi:hypothetical protein